MRSKLACQSRSQGLVTSCLVRIVLEGSWEGEKLGLDIGTNVGIAIVEGRAVSDQGKRSGTILMWF
jgi:hypothetical protein